jgi:hypothetical protein
MKFKAHLAEGFANYLGYSGSGMKLPRDRQKAGEMNQDDVKYMSVGKETDVYEIGTGDKKYAKVVSIFSTTGGGHAVTVQLADADGYFKGKKLTYKIVKG